MPVPNSEVARLFDEYADLLEIYGANEYRVRAYRTAARNISYLAESLAEMVRQGEDLTKIPGIAEDLAGKTTEIIKTGHLSALDRLKQTIPAELINITRIAGLGPRRAFRLYYDLGITNVKALEKAAREQQIRELPGFGIKSEQAILADLERRGELQEGKRVLYSIAEGLVQPLLAYLWEARGVNRVEPAGGYRRGMETVDGLSILITCDESSNVVSHFLHYEGTEKVLIQEPTHAAILMRHGFQVDLRIVPEEAFGAAWHYFTGSKAHCTAIRKLMARRRLQVSQDGIFKGENMIPTPEEEDIYAQVNLAYIEPELRENRGEIEAARANRLPNLITPENIRGDLHVHTSLTDGRSSLEQIAHAAQRKGYQYLAITEHSKHLTVAHGLNENRLAERNREIDKLNQQLSGIVLLKSIEVDILEDGSLDLSPSILRELDLVVCAVHSKFNLFREKQTERIIRAMHNPYFMILAHPSGRLINEREPYDVDMDKIITAARETGCVLELNAQPDRLDLEPIYCQKARERGVTIAISSDAHSVDELNFMHYGVIQARRGWLEASNVLNSKSWPDLKKILEKSRKTLVSQRASGNLSRAR